MLKVPMAAMTAMGLMAVLTSGTALLLAGCSGKDEKRQDQGRQQTAAASARIDWKMASAFEGSVPLMGTGGVYFSETLEKASGGAVRIRFNNPGELVPALDVFAATSEGRVDAAWSAAGYWSEKIPAASLFTGVPFGPDTSEFLAWLYHGGGLRIWQEIYGRHNIVPIPCGAIPPEASGWFTKPVTSLEQFKGMKIRFYGLGGEAMQKLGASVQLLAAGEIYQALERNMLDATEFSLPSIDRKYNFNKVASHYYFPGWHQQVSILELLINRERWNGLSPADQALINAVCRDTIVQSITMGEFRQGEALDYFKNQGVEIHYWPDSIIQGFKKAYDEVVKEKQAGDADFRRVYQSYESFRKKYSPW
ncbi:MAG: TRAP transporter substrate-binding protein, partial [Deltaproteobacteria bacterium]|nr:TRAP transporter substrate-binding protein [Deltaproteobacteria bacterium]